MPHLYSTVETHHPRQTIRGSRWAAYKTGKTENRKWAGMRRFRRPGNLERMKWHRTKAHQTHLPTSFAGSWKSRGQATPAPVFLP